MKTFFTFLFLIIIITGTFAQDLNLDSCQIRARRNHPILRKLHLMDQISNLNQQNLKVLNLPQFDLSMRASWQSEVTKISLGLPGITGPDPLSKDQYKAYVDIKQKIFDGGVVKKREELEETDLLVSKQQIETEIYRIREIVNSLFFNNLIIQENLKINKLKQETLDARIKIVKSAVDNGVALPNELDQLRAEKLMAEQQETELNSSRFTNLTLLEIITGTEIKKETSFILPEESPMKDNYSRPEEKLFSLQQEKLEKNKALLSSSRKPNVFAFGQAGYGRPGLNMLKNDFDDWYIIGAGLSWNILDWKTTNRKKAALILQQEIISANTDDFNRSLQMSMNQEENNFQKIKNLIRKDEEIYLIKDQISKRSAAALENGTITSADYIRDLNSSLQAKANLETRKIQLVQSSVNIQTIQGSNP